MIAIRGLGIEHQPIGQLGHPVDLVGDRAQLFVEGDPLQTLRVLGEGLLAVDIPEKTRVRQAGGEHLAVAVDHACAAVFGLDIGGADEGVGEFALVVLADEIFLVHAGGELDRLGRNLKEVFLEPPEQRDGPLSEAGVLDDQPFILDQLEGSFGRNLGSARTDQVLPFLVIDDHMRGAQFHRIIFSIADGDVAGMVEAVAERDRARGDAMYLAVDHIVAQQRNDSR